MKVQHCNSEHEFMEYINNYCHKKRNGLIPREPTQHDFTVLKYADYWIDAACEEIDALRFEVERLREMVSRMSDGGSK